MSAKLYHFITGHVKTKTKALDRFKDVVNDGVIKSSSVRNNEPIGWITKNDPEEDRDYIFLTANRTLMSTVYSIKPFMEKLKPDTGIFGFTINANKLRNQPGVKYRPHDIAWDDAWNPNITEDFTDQPITQDCEVLVPKELRLTEIDKFIFEDTEVTHV